MDGRLFLLQEMTLRKNRNPAYSLRAFARDLGVSPTALSQYLSRQRELSKRNRALVMERLRLSPMEQNIFKLGKRIVNDTHSLIHEDTFRMISDWVSLATLNLAGLKTNFARPKWVAKRLAITESEAVEVMERLKRLKLIRVNRGRMQRTGRPFTTTQDIPSAAIKKFHGNLLQKGERALTQVAITERDFSAMVMPTDLKKILTAKKIIKKMIHKVSDLVSSSKAEEVYVMAVQFYPLSQPIISKTIKGKEPL